MLGRSKRGWHPVGAGLKEAIHFGIGTTASKCCTYYVVMPSRRVRAAGLLSLVAAAVVAGGCSGSGSDTPALCDSIETLSSDLDGLRDINLDAGEAVLPELEESFESIPSNLEALKIAAEVDEGMQDLDTAIDALSTQVDKVRAGAISTEAVTALREAIASVRNALAFVKQDVRERGSSGPPGTCSVGSG